jgi:hypothetical protein
MISQEERERFQSFLRVSKKTHTKSSKGIDAILDVYKLPIISQNPLISKFPKPIINLQIIQNPLIPKSNSC